MRGIRKYNLTHRTKLFLDLVLVATTEKPMMNKEGQLFISKLVFLLIIEKSSLLALQIPTIMIKWYNLYSSG